MKKKDKEQLRTLSIVELQKKIKELNDAVQKIVRDGIAKQGKDVHGLKKIRIKLAVLKTFVRQKELIHE